MSVFDLFRGFFGVPGGRYRGDDRREPFFEGLIHEDDDDDDEAADGFHDDVFRFGFSFGPNGMRFREPPVFGRIFQEMDDIFSGLGHFGRDLPGIEAPPREEAEEHSRRRGRSYSSPRGFMFKNPDESAPKGTNPSSPGGPGVPRSPFYHWKPFPQFKGIWGDELRQWKEERKEDTDLDSQVSSGGLDQILTPSPSQPNTRSFYKSVTVTKVVKPDGTVEERRTVRDGQGNEETTVTRSGGLGGPEPAAPTPGGSFSDINNDFSMFTKFFEGFRR